MSDTERYRDEMGHDPPEAPDEYRWQWEYRGSRDKRDMLLDRLAGADVDDEQPTQEETLW